MLTSLHDRARAFVLATAVAVATIAVPIAVSKPADALTLRCTPAAYYVPLGLVPGTARAANQGCIYRQALKATPVTAYTWRGVGTQRCLNIWRASTEYKWMSWQQKVTVLPTWCAYYAGHFIWWF